MLTLSNNVMTGRKTQMNPDRQSTGMIRTKCNEMTVEGGKGKRKNEKLTKIANEPLWCGQVFSKRLGRGRRGRLTCSMT
jgi:hypothetical protein